MNIERAILIGFLGNYLVNTVLAALVSLIPAGGATGLLTPQYITFVVLSAILTAILTWWYMKEGERGIKGGAVFGVTGFVVAILTVFVTGIAGVLAQTGSFSGVITVLPNFGPFLINWTTLVLLGYWVIPPVLVGWWKPAAGVPQKPMMGAMSSSGMRV